MVQLVSAYALRGTQAVSAYWQTLFNTGLLKYRLPDVDCPTVADALALTEDIRFIQWFVLNGRNIVAEVMLSDFNAYSALVHFSVHPGWLGSKVGPLAKEVWDLVLSCKRADGSPLVRTLVGMLPECNFTARRVVEKIGWERQGRITNAMICKYAKTPLQAVRVYTYGKEQ